MNSEVKDNHVPDSPCEPYVIGGREMRGYYWFVGLVFILSVLCELAFVVFAEDSLDRFAKFAFTYPILVLVFINLGFSLLCKQSAIHSKEFERRMEIRGKEYRRLMDL